MEMTERLKKALDEVMGMGAPTVEKLLSKYEYHYEANRVAELRLAWLEANSLQPAPHFVVYTTNTDNGYDEVFADNVEIVTIDYARVEDGACPYCKEQGAYTYLVTMPVPLRTSTLCKFCKFDSEWDGETALAWLNQQYQIENGGRK